MTNQFSQLFCHVNVRKEINDALYVLTQNKTVNIAREMCETGHYKDVIQFIVKIFEVYKKDVLGQKGENPVYNGNYKKNEPDDSFSDVLYWEAVHEGEIVPDQGFSDTYDYDDDYSYSSGYDYDDDTIKIEQKREMETYIDLLTDATDLSVEEKIVFLQYFANVKKGSSLEWKANYQLRSLRTIQQVKELLPEFEFLAKKYNLTINNRSYPTTVSFDWDTGDTLVKFFLTVPIDDMKKDDFGNELSIWFYKGNHDSNLRFAMEVYKTIGIEVDERYYNTAKKLISKEFKDGVSYSVAEFESKVVINGLEIHFINHGMELRSFFKRA